MAPSPRNLRRLVRRLGAERAAERLRVSERTLARWLSAGVPERRAEDVGTAIAASDDRSRRSKRAAETRASKRTEVRELAKAPGARELLAERYGVSPATIQRWERTGIPPSRRRARADVAEQYAHHRAGVEAAETRASKRTEIATLIEAKGSKRAAKILGVSQSTARRWAREGVPRDERDDVQHRLDVHESRSRSAQRTAEVRSFRRDALQGASESVSVEIHGITGIRFDRETRLILGEDEGGRLMACYGVKNRLTGEVNYLWTTKAEAEGWTPQRFQETYERVGVSYNIGDRDKYQMIFHWDAPDVDAIAELRELAEWQEGITGLRILPFRSTTLAGMVTEIEQATGKNVRVLEKQILPEGAA